jgi:predicted enzyme related to lactoylglutathione lyase
MSNSQATAVKTGIIKGIDIAAFLVKDPQAQTAFYRDVLGMVPTEIDSEGRGTEFTLADGSTFGVWKPDDGATGPAFMFAVENIDQALAEFRSRGLEVSEPMDTPVCRMAFTKDPEGNGLIIHQRTVKD